MDCIYGIIDTRNNKIYVGSAINFEKRKYQHFKKLKANQHRNNLLQRLYNKYGQQIFKFFVLEYISNKNDLLKREQIWINYFQSYNINFGYNLNPVAGSRLGRKTSEETKAKQRIVHKGKIISEETKIKMSKARLGKKASDETKKKMSEARKRNLALNYNNMRVIEYDNNGLIKIN